MKNSESLNLPSQHNETLTLEDLSPVDVYKKVLKDWHRDTAFSKGKNERQRNKLPDGDAREFLDKKTERINKLGWEFAVRLYSAVNFGSVAEMEDKVKHLKIYSRSISNSSERTLLTDVVRRFEVPLANARITQVREEIRQDLSPYVFKSKGWGNYVKHLTNEAVDIKNLSITINKHRAAIRNFCSTDARLSTYKTDDLDELIKYVERNHIVQYAGKKFEVNEVYGLNNKDNSVEDYQKFINDMLETLDSLLNSKDQRKSANISNSELVSKLFGKETEQLNGSRRFKRTGRQIARGVLRSGPALVTAGLLYLGASWGLEAVKSADESNTIETPKTAYQEQSRQYGLTGSINELRYGLPIVIQEVNTIRTVTTQEVETLMRDTPLTAYEECLVPQTLENGTVVFSYSTEGVDKAICEEFFPSINLADTEYEQNTTPFIVEIPESLKEDISIPYLIAGIQKGNTCALTTVATAINTLRALHGENSPVYHPWVLSNLFKPKEDSIRYSNSEDSLINPMYKNGTQESANNANGTDSLNYFFVDTVGLSENFNIMFDRSYITEFRGMSYEEIKTHVLENPQESAKSVYDAYKYLLDEGNLPTFNSRVHVAQNEDGSNVESFHQVLIIGTRVNPATGDYELLAYEPNGGYTGWSQTKDDWELLSERGQGIISIPLNEHTMIESLGFRGSGIRFYSYTNESLDTTIEKVSLTREVSNIVYLAPFPELTDVPADEFMNLTITTGSTISSNVLD